MAIFSKSTIYLTTSIILSIISVIYFPCVWLNSIFVFWPNSSVPFHINDVPFYSSSVIFTWRWIYSVERFGFFWIVLLTDCTNFVYPWLQFVLVDFDTVYGEGKSPLRLLTYIFAVFCLFLHCFKAIYGILGALICNSVNPCRSYTQPGVSIWPNWVWFAFIIGQIAYAVTYLIIVNVIKPKNQPTPIIKQEKKKQ